MSPECVCEVLAQNNT